jgi:hypothetical protein
MQYRSHRLEDPESGCHTWDEHKCHRPDADDETPNDQDRCWYFRLVHSLQERGKEPFTPDVEEPSVWTGNPGCHCGKDPDDQRCGEELTKPREAAGDVLKPCEMPPRRVIDFLTELEPDTG